MALTREVIASAAEALADALLLRRSKRKKERVVTSRINYARGLLIIVTLTDTASSDNAALLALAVLFDEL